MRKYLFFLSIIVFIVTLSFYLAQKRGADLGSIHTWWLLPLIFFLISISGHALILKSFKSNPKQFMIHFLIAAAVKMFLYLGLLVIWFIISGHKLPTGFAVAFCVLYFSIMFLDIIMVLFMKKKFS